MRALVLLEKKIEPDRALSDSNESIRLDPKRVDGYILRSMAWLSRKEYDKAIVDCDAAIQIDSRLSMAYNTRGWAMLAKREYGQRFGLETVYQTSRSSRVGV